MARSRTSNGSANSSASLGFEAKLWLATDQLRSNMDAAEYKHVVLGLSIEEHGKIGAAALTSLRTFIF